MEFIDSKTIKLDRELNQLDIFVLFKEKLNPNKIKEYKKFIENERKT